MWRPGSAPAIICAMRRASHSREAEFVSLRTSLASTGMATGRRTAGSRTTTAAITQLLPYPVFAGPGADPSWNQDAAHTFFPRLLKRMSSIATVTGSPAGTSSATNQAGDGQAQVIGIPAGTGEEEVRPVMAPGPGQSRPGQHAAHTPLSGLRQEPAGQAAEGTERRGGEQTARTRPAGWPAKREAAASCPGTSAGTPFHQRFLHTRIPQLRGGARQAAPAPRRPLLTAAGRAAAIMDSVPDTPDQQTRTAVTQRIIAHVRRGWPRLGEPIVRHRGRFCYVSVLLPGHREPTPILRLRYQGSADRWAIGIYLASSGQYTESELPASSGPKTGTPEQGIDDTFILYAGPKSGR